MSQSLSAGVEFLNFLNVVESEMGQNSYNEDPTRPVATGVNQKMTIDNVRQCRKIWDATMDFCADADLFSADQLGNRTIGGYGFESLNDGVSLANIGSDRLNMLCENAGLPNVPAVRKEAIAALSLAITRAKSGRGVDGVASHYSSNQDNSLAMSHYGSMFAAGTTSDMLAVTATPSMESFGANMDQVITDTRMTIAVTLLRFAKSCLNRIAHRRPRATTRIDYEIPYAEFYSLEKSHDPKAEVRNGREHRTIMLDLYRNPTPVTQKLQAIIPQKALDTTNSVVRDGVLAPGISTNLFTLALQANRPGHDHADWTDLVSEGVTMDKLYVVLTDSTNPAETFCFETGRERLLPTAQNRDSSFRSGQFVKQIRLHKGVKTAAGADSKILATLTDSDYLVATVNFTATIYLKTADVNGYGSITLAPHAVNGTSVLAAALASKVGASFEGYSLCAFFSEENLRKSNIMFRTNKFMRSYEIMCGANYMIDYSLQQQLEEFSMAMVTEGMSIGMDDRAIALFEENANIVYNRLHDEDVDDSYMTNNLMRINFDYVAGTRVNPWVYIDTIDLRNVDSIRSSDFMSDVRQYFDTRLTRIISLSHANSLYTQQLEPGEEVVYKVIASRIVIENLLQVPHIHNNVAQLEDSKEADGQVIEFSRKLTSGVTLHCVSLPWDKMRDKIVIMPFRPNFPDSELNYCHNWDYGTFLAHYTPQVANGVNKRIFMNARETPVITNPNIIILTVAYFDEIIQLTRGTN